jgi:hypothetical protein
VPPHAKASLFHPYPESPSSLLGTSSLTIS